MEKEKEDGTDGGSSKRRGKVEETWAWGGREDEEEIDRGEGEREGTGEA